MTERDVIERLRALYPEILHVYAFYASLDKAEARTPLEAMKHQVHLNAAAVKLANSVHTIIAEADAG